jgi:hypothetical protein
LYCKNCGADIIPGMTFCGNCGMRVDAEEQAAQPETGASDFAGETAQPENDQYQSTYQNQPETFVKPEKSCNPVLWIVLSAVETLLCCQFIPGIIGLVFAIMGSSAKSEGDFEKAAKYCKYSMIAVIVGAVLAVLCTIALIVFSISAGVEMAYAAGELMPYAEEYIREGYQYFDPSQFHY